MATVHDVAAYILSNSGPMTAMRLQKLAYYSQAWSLVWDEQVLFPERIEAWANGPVVVELYKEYQGSFIIEQAASGDIDELSPDQWETIDVVLNQYGKLTAQQLSDQTHSEAPWIDARKGMSPNERGNSEITHAALHEYYSGL
jgi:uncharacterized phage-associated protein